MANKLVDLSHVLNEKAPSWTGSQGFESQVKLDYDGGCRVQKLVMHAGVGTHIDAPAHFVQGGRDVASLTLAELCAPLYVIDVRESVANNETYQATLADIKKYENQHGQITKNSVVVVWTGWEQRWHDTESYRNVDAQGVMRFPSVSKDAADMLIDRGVVGVGIDTLSPDPADSDFPVHHTLLRADKYILENLTNLAHVPHSGALVVVAPLNIANGTEAPTRVIAIVE